MRQLLILFALVGLLAAQNHRQVQDQVRQGLELISALNNFVENPDINSIGNLMPRMTVAPALIGMSKAAGVIGGVIDILWPDEPSGPSNAEVIAEIRRTYEKLSRQIANVRQDIRNLEQMIKWGNTRLEYAGVVRVITTAIELNERIRTATDQAGRLRRQDRFRSHCESQGLQMNVNTLIDGLTGQGAFPKNILANFYTDSKGHRPHTIKLSGRLLNLALGGLFALMSFETIKYGPAGGDDMAQDYQPKMVTTRASVETAVNQCTTNARTWMAGDFTELTNQHTRSSYAACNNAIFNFMSAKYDWFDIYVATTRYLRMSRDSYYSAFGKNRRRYNINGKNVMMIYYEQTQSRNVPAAVRSRARSIMAASGGGYASQVGNRVIGNLQRSNIPFHGYYVVRAGADARRMTASMARSHVGVSARGFTQDLFLR